MSEKTWPSFLDRLDIDPDAAFKGFYRFAWKTLNQVPPRAMRGLGEPDRQDVIHDIVYHCVRDDFRVLRRYVDKGKPFAAWLYVVAHHKCLDRIRAGRLENEALSIHEDADGRGLEMVLSDPADDPAKRVEAREVLEAVKTILARMGQYCRLLLEMAADELTPREMVLVLRLPASQNKKVSDDLRYCRDKLRRRLREAGIELPAR